ncbi:MAG: wax ester/triacylglycerol synthase family O-acyltransferase [Actinomycetia bacterium]|nr:wax ester/triacylglycerol synthase family O-acyltransferase [Actinomycetes bacterium]
MDRLSGLDASFLYLETPTQPLHVSSVLELDTSTMPGGYSYDRLRDDLSSRIKAAPRFREKIADSWLNLDHPAWVEDSDFDIDRHVKRVSLPSPGGHHELAQVCGDIVSRPLDRSRPLWEMWVIEGHASDDSEGGPLAVMTKAHHAAVDGVAGAQLLSQLCSNEPDAAPPDPIEGPGEASMFEIAATGLLNFATRPALLARVLPTTVSAALKTLRRIPSGSTMAAPFAAPATTFNAAVTGLRDIAFAQLDLDDIKTVKNKFGVKVNDVVMSIGAGAVRQFLVDHGELPDPPLVAMVPVSVRGKSDRHGRNQITGMFSCLETHIAEPAERLRAIARANTEAKQHHSAIGPAMLQDWAQFAARSLGRAAMSLYPRTPLTRHPVHNLIFSNVAGPQTPLYFLGSEIKAMYPFGPIHHGSGLNITVMSLNGKLDVGITSCPSLLPDVSGIADYFPEALKDLLETRSIQSPTASFATSRAGRECRS